MYFHNPKCISTLLNTCIRFIVPVSLHYQICIFTSLNTCFRFTAHAYPHYQLRVFTLPNTCFYIIKYTYPFHRKRAFVPHFVGVYVYAGTINRPLRLRTDCDNVANIPQNANKQSVKYPHTPTKWGANTPLGVGADSSRPYPDINKNVYFHNQIYISTLLNTYFHIIEYIHKFHCKRAFVPHFVGVFIYAGTINRPLRLRTVCQNIANGLR